jgi:hypothetical protein
MAHTTPTGRAISTMPRSGTRRPRRPTSRPAGHAAGPASCGGSCGSCRRRCRCRCRPPPVRPARGCAPAPGWPSRPPRPARRCAPGRSRRRCAAPRGPARPARVTSMSRSTLVKRSAEPASSRCPLLGKRPPLRGWALGLDVGVLDQLGPLGSSACHGAAASFSGVPPTPSAPWASSFSLISGSATRSFSALFSFSITGLGVLAGTNIAYQLSTSKSATPASCTVGTSGKAALRLTVDTASALSLPVLTNCAAAGIDTHSVGTWLPITSVMAGPPPGRGCGSS